MEQIFKDNPKLDVAYKTADGKYFFLENDAKNYALTLEDKRVIKVENNYTERSPLISEKAEVKEENQEQKQEKIDEAVSKENQPKKSKKQ